MFRSHPFCQFAPKSKVLSAPIKQTCIKTINCHQASSYPVRAGDAFLPRASSFRFLSQDQQETSEPHNLTIALRQITLASLYPSLLRALSGPFGRSWLKSLAMDHARETPLEFPRKKTHEKLLQLRLGGRFSWSLLPANCFQDIFIKNWLKAPNSSICCLCIMYAVLKVKVNFFRSKSFFPSYPCGTGQPWIPVNPKQREYVGTYLCSSCIRLANIFPSSQSWFAIDDVNVKGHIEILFLQNFALAPSILYTSDDMKKQPSNRNTPVFTSLHHTLYQYVQLQWSSAGSLSFWLSPASQTLLQILRHRERWMHGFQS